MTRSEEIVQNMQEAIDEYKTAVLQNLRLEIVLHERIKRNEQIKVLIEKWKGKSIPVDLLIVEIEDLL